MRAVSHVVATAVGMSAIGEGVADLKPDALDAAIGATVWEPAYEAFVFDDTPAL